MERKFCAFCGKGNQSFAEYCLGCGNKLSESNFNTVNENSKTKDSFKKRKNKQEYVVVSGIRKKYGYRSLIILIAIASLLVYTNPDEKMHIDWGKEKIRNKIRENTSAEPSFLDSFIQEVGIELSTYAIKRKDYIFFSITVFDFGNEFETKPMAIGVLKNFIDLEDVDKLIDDFSSYLLKVRSSN